MDRLIVALFLVILCAALPICFGWRGKTSTTTTNRQVVVRGFGGSSNDVTGRTPKRSGGGAESDGAARQHQQDLRQVINCVRCSTNVKYYSEKDAANLSRREYVGGTEAYLRQRTDFGWIKAPISQMNWQKHAPNTRNHIPA